jgi:hypothetical protein
MVAKRLVASDCLEQTGLRLTISGPIDSLQKAPPPGARSHAGMSGETKRLPVALAHPCTGRGNPSPLSIARS